MKHSKRLIAAALLLATTTTALADEDADIPPLALAAAKARAIEFIGPKMSHQQAQIIGENYATVNWSEDKCDRPRGLWFRLLAMMAKEKDQTVFMHGMAIGVAKLVDLENTKSRAGMCESFWGFYGKGSKQLFDGALE